MESVADRFGYWSMYEEPQLPDAERAKAYEEFADGFEGMSPKREPYEGWAETMAYLCRRLAKWHRGEHPGEWVPSWERKRAEGVAGR